MFKINQDVKFTLKGEEQQGVFQFYYKTPKGDLQGIVSQTKKTAPPGTVTGFWRLLFLPIEEIRPA